MRQFIITGAARSGTQYISQALTLLGISCGHEEMFNVDTAKIFAQLERDYGVVESWGFNDNVPVIGEVSWLATPYLGVIGPEIAILHQVRDPINVARSLMGIGFANKTRDVGNEGTTPWVRENFPDIFAYDNPFDICVAYWVKWNLMTEKRAKVRYKIEDLNAHQLHSIITALDGNKTLEEVTEVLKNMPRAHRGVKTKSLSWDDIKDEDLQMEAFELSKKYGYWVEEV